MTLHHQLDLTWTLGDRLHKSRKAAGVSVEAMAKALGVSRNTVTNWETGRAVPRRGAVIAWAQVTGAPFDWLAEEVDLVPLGRVRRSGFGRSSSGWKLTMRELPLAA
jgi:transcriptional regulator with XRE-family HTH domain